MAPSGIEPANFRLVAQCPIKDNKHKIFTNSATRHRSDERNAGTPSPEPLNQKFASLSHATVFHVARSRGALDV